MATTNETMKVIADGLDRDITVQITDYADEYEPTEVEELVSDIVLVIAEKAGANFVQLVEHTDPECVETILKLLRKLFYGSLIYALHTMFIAAGMKNAAWDLDILDICCEYDEATSDYFYDYFFISEALTDYHAEMFPDEEEEEIDSSPEIKLN